MGSIWGMKDVHTSLAVRLFSLLWCPISSFWCPCRSPELSVQSSAAAGIDPAAFVLSYYFVRLPECPEGVQAGKGKLWFLLVAFLLNTNKMLPRKKKDTRTWWLFFSWHSFHSLERLNQALWAIASSLRLLQVFITCEEMNEWMSEWMNGWLLSLNTATGG